MKATTTAGNRHLELREDFIASARSCASTVAAAWPPITNAGCRYPKTSGETNKLIRQ